MSRPRHKMWWQCTCPDCTMAAQLCREALNAIPVSPLRQGTPEYEALEYPNLWFGMPPDANSRGLDMIEREEWDEEDPSA